MKIETLKERVKNAETKVVKITGTLARHNTQLVKKSKILTDKGIDLNNYDKRSKAIAQETSWELYELENKQSDIKNNEKKLAEVTNTLAKLTEQLRSQLAKEAETDNLIPEVLNVFLENWKKKCFEFYSELATDYIELVAIPWTEYKITLDGLSKVKEEVYNRKYNSLDIVNKYTQGQIEKILSNDISESERRNILQNIRYGCIEQFEKKRFASDMSVVNKIICNSTIDNNELNKILDYDVKEKKETFIKRIKQVIGEIKDLSGLQISGKGEIDGIAKGVECNAKVETIGCAGYNIVAWHFRTLVNTIR